MRNSLTNPPTTAPRQGQNQSPRPCNIVLQAPPPSTNFYSQHVTNRNRRKSFRNNKIEISTRNSFPYLQSLSLTRLASTFAALATHQNLSAPVSRYFSRNSNPINKTAKISRHTFAPFRAQKSIPKRDPYRLAEHNLAVSPERGERSTNAESGPAGLKGPALQSNLIGPQSGDLLLGQELLERRDDLEDGALPKRRRWMIFPRRRRRKDERHIPVKALAGLGPRRMRGDLLQGEGDLMARIPELTRARVRNSGQRAAAGRAPIGDKDRFPDNQDSHFPLRMLRKKLLGCGGPPQTKGSSGREQQNKARDIGIRIKSGGEWREAGGGERGEWRLALRHRSGHPQIERQERQNDGKGDNRDELLLHRGPRADRSAMNAATC